jgi:hypothetical protein
LLLKGAGEPVVACPGTSPDTGGEQLGREFAGHLHDDLPMAPGVSHFDAQDGNPFLRGALD